MTSEGMRLIDHLLQDRYGSVALAEAHLMHAASYLALNPVRAHLVRRAQEWPHSSVRAHLAGRDDGLVRVRPLLDRAPRFADLLDGDVDGPAFAPLRRSELIGRPLGDDAFLDALALRLGRSVKPGKRRRKRGHTGEHVARDRS